MKRLDDVVVGATVEPLGDVRHGRPFGDQDRWGGMVCADELEQVDPW
jgi:hypothetical protein